MRAKFDERRGCIQLGAHGLYRYQCVGAVCHAGHCSSLVLQLGRYVGLKAGLVGGRRHVLQKCCGPLRHVNSVVPLVS